MNKRMAVLLGVCFALSHQTFALAAEQMGPMCGGIAGKKCADPTQYCDLGVGTCKVADASGACKKKPEICTEEFVPVCGCDGNRYSNACHAAMKGVSVDYLGECKDQPNGQLTVSD